MNRRNRHLVVLAIAVVTATMASFGVYRAVERMPARERRSRAPVRRRRRQPLPMGTR